LSCFLLLLLEGLNEWPLLSANDFLLPELSLSLSPLFLGKKGAKAVRPIGYGVQSHLFIFLSSLLLEFSSSSITVIGSVSFIFLLPSNSNQSSLPDVMIPV